MAQEWKDYLHELHEVVQQILTENHVQTYSQLSFDEQIVFLDRALNITKSYPSSATLRSYISQTLNKKLNENMKEYSVSDLNPDTKTDQVQYNIEEAIVSILKRHPDLRVKLRCCFNQVIPKSIQQWLWKLTFSDPLLRKTYAKTLKSTTSSQSFEAKLSKKYELILNKQSTFAELKNSAGAIRTATSTLLFYTTQTKRGTDISDGDYLLVIPFMFNASPLPSNEPAAFQTRATLAEQFTTFMEMRPSFISHSSTQPADPAFKDYMKRVIAIIDTQNPHLLTNLAAKLKHPPDKIITTATLTRALLLDVLHAVVSPILYCLFVGYLSEETPLFIWNQYVLGYNNAEYIEEFLAIIMAHLMLLIDGKLQNCSSVSEIESTIAIESRKLSVSQFQYNIKRFHFDDLWALLTKNGRHVQVPLDATKMEYPHWRHWYNESAPPYTRATDQGRVRDMRIAERQRLLELQKEAEQLKIDKRERDLREENRKFKESAVIKGQQSEEMLMSLKQQLKAEEERRLNYEEFANAEIERLQEKLKHYEIHKRYTAKDASHKSASSIGSMAILPVPHTPSPALGPRTQCETVIIDILQRVANSVDKIAHGEGDERHKLNEETELSLERHIAYVKRAEVVVFGRELNSGEFDRLSPTQQQDSCDKMMNLIRQWKQRPLSDI